MMNTLKYMSVAMAMALLPMTANAAITFDAGNDIASGDIVEIFDGPFSFGSTFTANNPDTGIDEPAGFFEFTFTNSTADIKTVALTVATINQSVFGSFVGDVITEWLVGGASRTTAAGTADSFTLATSLAANSSDTLRISYSAFDHKGANGDIDFIVGAVPLPASVLMFLSALGGLGLIARRRRQAAIA